MVRQGSRRDLSSAILPAVKRTINLLTVVHRYMGLVFCVIFVIWFASGIVMIYARMPGYEAAERLARTVRGSGLPAGERQRHRRQESRQPRHPRQGSYSLGTGAALRRPRTPVTPAHGLWTPARGPTSGAS